jgi:predicted nucleic acid-binding Zn ribbon protein
MKTCSICGKPLPPGSNNNKRYCGRKCQYAGHLENQRLRATQFKGVNARQKSVMVQYAGTALPDWYSKTEYQRNKNAFQPDDRIWIDGHEITQQPALFEMEA